MGGWVGGQVGGWMQGDGWGAGLREVTCMRHAKRVQWPRDGARVSALLNKQTGLGKQQLPAERCTLLTMRTRW